MISASCPEDCPSPCTWKPTDPADTSYYYKILPEWEKWHRKITDG